MAKGTSHFRLRKERALLMKLGAKLHTFCSGTKSYMFIDNSWKLVDDCLTYVFLVQLNKNFFTKDSVSEIILDKIKLF